MASVYSAVITWEGAGQLFANVLHFFLSESGGLRPDQYADLLITGIENDTIPVWLDIMSTTVNLTSIKAQKVSGDGGPAVTRTYGPTDFEGTRAGEIGNTSENVCLEFPVLLNAKNVTGKIFCSGILDADIVDNVIADTAKTRVEALGTSLLASRTLSGGAGDYHYVIWNRANALFASPTFRRLSPVVGSQRRRLRP